MVMLGELFEYAPGLCAFDSLPSAQRVLILLGGLSDGFLTIPYTKTLTAHLASFDISLTQVLMKSSYSQYGMSSIEEDRLAIIKLIKYYKEQGKRVFLLGHSTGCQDVLWLLSKTPDIVIDGAILQAPVSDREYAFDVDPTGTEELLCWANSVDDLYKNVRLVNRVPMSAYRVKALYEKMGDDDFFSSDLTVEQMKSKIGKLAHVPLFAIHSGEDEYIPKWVDKEELYRKLETAYSLDTIVIPKANHGISLPDCLEIYCTSLIRFIDKII